ncbi:MAG: hypothetical protein HY841_12030 [Bacteroidetes bacterium]|nr:hypothetical protein [Bacteroidota bacterium]
MLPPCLAVLPLGKVVLRLCLATIPMGVALTAMQAAASWNKSLTLPAGIIAFGRIFVCLIN